MAIPQTNPIVIHVATESSTPYDCQLEETYANQLKESFINSPELERELNKQTLILLSPKASREAKNEAANVLRFYTFSLKKEAQLFRLIQSGNSDTMEKARNMLAISAFPIIYLLACKYSNKCPLLEERDLFSHGMEGVYEALAKYDPAKSNSAKFSTYAHSFIKHAISLAINRLTHSYTLTPAQVKRIRKILKVKMIFMIQNNGRAPTVDELAALLPKYSRHYIETYMNGLQDTISLEAPISSSDANTSSTKIGDTIPDPQENVLDKCFKNDLLALLRENLNSLDKRTQDILNYYYGLTGESPLKYEEIGKRLDLSTQSVSRIANEGLIQLRAKMTMPESAA